MSLRFWMPDQVRHDEQGSVLEGLSRRHLGLGGIRVFLADYLKAFLALGGHSILTVGTGKL
jgi:hypothetical protein